MTMSLRRFSITAALVLFCAAPAVAQGVKLEFHEGRVTLSAQNVALRQVLNEWARLGGTKIVNGDRVPGGLVTLELNGVPERQALDVLLRSASGYLAGPRPAGMAGASTYASILILPTSSAPRPAAAPAPPPIFRSGPRFPGQIPQAVPPPDPDDDPAGDVPPNDDPDDTPRPGVQRGRVPPGQPAPPQPSQPDNDQAPAPPVADPGNPFGV